MRWSSLTYPYTSVLLTVNWPTLKLNFHLYGPTNEGLAVPKQSADICHFYEKGIILTCVTSESPRFQLGPHPPLLIKIGELKRVCISLWRKHTFEFSRRSAEFYRRVKHIKHVRSLEQSGLHMCMTAGVFAHIFRLMSRKIPLDGCSVILWMFKYVEDLADLFDACVDLCSRPLGRADQTPSSHRTKESEVND